MSRTRFYQGVGPVLTVWEPDPAALSLTRLSEARLAANVQYVWRHPARHVLYAASSNGGPRRTGDRHFLQAFRIAPGSGALTAHGGTIGLRARPIHLSIDRAGGFALVAYNEPSGVTVHRLGGDGALGEEVRQTVPPDGGIYGHQVLATPDNDAVILVARGNEAGAGKPEDPGALKVFGFRDGQLTLRQTVAPRGGYGFGPRHIDFHPTLPLVFVSLERQNRLAVFGLRDGRLTPEPLFTAETLRRPGAHPPQQLAGGLHVHPNGRHVYVANRSDAMGEFEGRPIGLEGFENGIAVFDLDAEGRPSLAQSLEVGSFHPRTFSLDPSARMMVAATIAGRRVRDGAGTAMRPASLAIFLVGEDGRLAFSSSIPVETGESMQFWTGMSAA
ncbi:beta-propeller fold lactonase family protein [Roseococcus sp. SYP-B2431]|uniref:lactonase family protein n=1 Tax=Roseococcus sp. SYP-B2431 TaxID=2496640 RepID=UPI0013F407E4|nr:beta-propeller fold lactonase family protein [Roseococcus sp. SYP-B2431]